MADKLVLLEFVDEADALARSPHAEEARSGSAIVVALSAAAQLVLRSEDIPFRTTLPYFDNESHARALTRSEEWLGLIESHSGLSGALGAELSFTIRHLFSHFLWLAEVLAAASADIGPSRLCSPPGMAPIPDRDSKIAPGYRPLGFVIRDFAARNGMEYEELDVPVREDTARTEEPSPSERSGPTIASGLLALAVRWLARVRPSILLASKGYGLGERVRRLDGNLPRFTHLILDPAASGGSYRRMLSLVRGLVRAVLPWSSREASVRLPMWVFRHGGDRADHLGRQTATRLDSLAEKIETEWAGVFDHRGVGMARQIAEKVRTGIESHLVELAHAYGPLRAALMAARPNVVFSPYCIGIYNLLGQVSRELGIPAVMVTHGTHVPPRDSLSEIEQRRLSQSLMLAPTYEYTVAQSPWAARHASYFGAKQRTFNTGPLLYARTDARERSRLRQRLGLDDGVEVIVYAVTQKSRSTVKFHVFETEDEYLASMSDLVQAVNRMDRAHLVLKLHPASRLTDADIHALLPPCGRMSVLKKQPFSQVLSAADLLVSFSSTTIEEAILNGVPVVLFDKWARYRHVDSTECSASNVGQWPVDVAYYVDTSGMLRPALEHALRHAAEARTQAALRAKHLFGEGETHSLSHFVMQLTTAGGKE